MRARNLLLGTTLLSALILALPSRLTLACTIDNVASLMADGVPAMLSGSASHDASTWAPFTVAQAVAVGVPVRLTEKQADLARTLPLAVRVAPYRWAFGDGRAALGHAAVHRYAHAGTYRLTVSGYDRMARRWFAFDAAVLRVVPTAQLLRANLGYGALRGVMAVSGLTWPIDGALVAAVLILLVRRSRRASGTARLRRATHPGSASISSGNGGVL